MANITIDMHFYKAHSSEAIQMSQNIGEFTEAINLKLEGCLNQVTY